MGTFSGYTADAVPEIAPLLKKWIHANREYVHRCVDEDAPWWYLERASVSTVAAAAWLAKGIALEEYTTAKSRLPLKGRPRVSQNCRCDLYFSLLKNKKKNTHHDFICEAKLIWPKLEGENTERIL